MSRLFGPFLISLACCQLLQAAEPAPAPRAKDLLPLTGLAPAKIASNLCVYHYPVSTRSKECQTFVDQALGYYYSYVWIESARSFETALRHDPDCAFAWLGLYRGMDKWGRGGTLKPDAFRAVAGAAWPSAKLPGVFSKPAKEHALEQARVLMPRANAREQLLITAKLQERGMWPGVGPDDRRKKAQQTLDELLALYEDDEEGWFARAQVADGQHGPAPFYKALLKVNPLHPGANHEFVHFYEAIKRPALGWPFAEKYIESSPGIPHAFHMQAHLATRVGKWDHTTDWSAKAIELEKAYHQFQGVKPSEDHQFQHHMETLTKSLLHDGRFTELKTLIESAKGYGYSFKPQWFKLALAEKDWVAAEGMVSEFRKQDKGTGAYYAAILYLERGETQRAAAEVDTLRQSQSAPVKGGRNVSRGSNEQRLWEVQGRLLCQQGDGDAGCQLIRKVVDKTKNDFFHHAWGNGAVYMEWWGISALEGGNAKEAEEAFQEAMAHDAGSVKGALGLFALCERLGRNDEAARYLKVARRCWARAEPSRFEQMRIDMVEKANKVPTIATDATAAKRP
jgi:tetratricopeptide (TPR) repeat protein